MCMEGLVFAYPGQGQDKHLTDFDFKGLTLKSEPAKMIIGAATIPHYTMTSKLNVKAMKQLVNGAPLDRIFRTPEAREKYRYDMDSAIHRLTTGDAMIPVVRQIIRVCHFPLGESLEGELEDPTMPAGPDNLHLAEITCNAQILASGFKYNI